MGERPTRRLREARGRVTEVVRSDVFRSYAPGLAATAVVLAMLLPLL
jgi:hypothetical protein